MDLASTRYVFSLLDPVLAISGLLAVALMLLGLTAVACRCHHVLAPNLSGSALLACYGCAVWILYACFFVDSVVFSGSEWRFGHSSGETWIKRWSYWARFES